MHDDSPADGLETIDEPLCPALYVYLLHKYGEVPLSDTTTCFIIDDTVLEKSGVRMEGISRVFDPMKGRCVLGYKLLLCAFFDGKTRMVR